MNTIFILAVHRAANEGNLSDFIRHFGFDYIWPSNISLPRNRGGAAVGFALVRFRDEADAKRAVTILNGQIYKTRILRVTLSQTELWSNTDTAPKSAPIPVEEKKPIPSGPVLPYEPISHGYVGHADPKPLSWWLKLRESWSWLDSSRGQTTPLHAPDKDSIRTFRDRHATRKAA